MTTLPKTLRGLFLALEFRSIEHRFGDVPVLRGIDLKAEPGEITCLLGASGCGKTTLLRLAAGVYEVGVGEILLDGQTLARRGLNPPPEKRPVGLVFQEGALFPHLSVEQNVAFGLRGQGATSRVSKMLEKVGLQAFAKAYPHTLSGGQQQRVALARALAPEPRVLLLDEPFASVDVVLRQHLREETRRLLREQDTIAVLVTHDPDEALEIGDKIAVLSEGAIVQHGPADEIYTQPKSASVAEFFGRGQRLLATQAPEGVSTPFGIWPTSGFSSPLPNGPLELVARPEALVLSAGGEGIVEDVRPAGPQQKVFVTAQSGERIAVLAQHSGALKPGQKVSVQPRPGSVFAFSRAS